MSKGELVAKAIHNSPLIIPLGAYIEELEKKEAMTSPIEDAFTEKGVMANDDDHRDASHLTPIDLDDLRQNPANYSISDIKKLLKERDLSITGKKSVLIDRLAMHG